MMLFWLSRGVALGELVINLLLGLIAGHALAALWYQFLLMTTPCVAWSSLRPDDFIAFSWTTGLMRMHKSRTHEREKGFPREKP
jgi:hypothetical protein